MASAVQRQDKAFSGVMKGSAIFIVALVASIGIFLLWSAIPSLRENTVNFFTYDGVWQTDEAGEMKFGIPNLLWTTLVVSVVALLFALPVAMGISLALSFYFPKKLAKPLTYMVELLAAVPSIVYGIWGAGILGPTLGPLFQWISDHLGPFIPFLRSEPGDPPLGTARTVLTGAIVLAIMILPIITATAREVYSQTPKGHIEAALGLGATRWEVMKLAVLPFGRSGLISGSMLGLGRALGETMALFMVIAGGVFHGSLFDAGTTFATLIAQSAAEFKGPLSTGAYIAAGLVLFVLTFIVNSIARVAIAKKAK